LCLTALQFHIQRSSYQQRTILSYHEILSVSRSDFCTRIGTKKSPTDTENHHTRQQRPSIPASSPQNKSPQVSHEYDQFSAALWKKIYVLYRLPATGNQSPEIPTTNDSMASKSNSHSPTLTLTLPLN